MTEERAGGWQEPTEDQIRRLESLTAHPARLRYFFIRLGNPSWLERLADHGWFDPERVPEPVSEADGTGRIEPWPLSGYLCRVAGEVPSTAAAVVKSVAGTANPLVQRDLVTAVLQFPAELAANFTDDVTAWVRGPYARSLDERQVTELAVKLLNSGQQEAGQRLASVILTWLAESYWLDEAVTMLADPLQRSGLSGVLVLVDALDHAIGDDASAEMASFARASIADHDQNQYLDAADRLVDGLRDCAFSYLNRTGDDSVLTALVHRRAVLHTRIAYYVLASALAGTDGTSAGPDAARIEALRDYARTLLMDRSAFANLRTRLEYGALAQVMLAHLQPADLDQMAAWIREGPPMSDAEISHMLGSPSAPGPAERVAAFKDHWRADRIGVLGADLPQQLRDIASDLTARGVTIPAHPGFSRWMSELSIESPLSAQELASMNVTDVAELLRSYQPPADTISRFPEYALAQQLTDDIAARPAEYSRYAEDFAGLQAGYANAFLNGLRQAIEARGRRGPGDGVPPLEVAWEPVLDLAASIAGIPDPGGRNTEQPENSPRWLHRDAAGLIKAGLAAASSGLAAEHADDILAVLSRLLQSPDPHPDDDLPEDTLDPADRALNSVRGQAALCLVAVANWWIMLGNTEEGAPPALLELLSSELEPDREPSTAVRTVYGWFFPLLYARLPAWAGGHIQAIFGSPAAESQISPHGQAEIPEQTPADQLGQAAFDAYLLANSPPDRGFLDLLMPYYQREIIRLQHPSRTWRSAMQNTRQALLDHLLLFLLWDALEADNPLVRLAIRRAGPAESGAAFGRLGWRIFHADGPESALMQRAQDLWTWWRGRAQVRAGNGDQDAAVAMLVGFPWWWRAGNLDPVWQFGELLQVLKTSPVIETPGLVAQTITDRVEGNEAAALTALDVILDNTTDNVQLQDVVMKSQPALRHLLQMPDPEIRQQARILIQKIAGWGMVELAKRITTASP